MEIQEHPSRFFWTFGNHEPLSMYRRIGRNSTGGVPGGALWLEKWHHWYDSEECAETIIAACETHVEEARRHVDDTEALRDARQKELREIQADIDAFNKVADAYMK